MSRPLRLLAILAASIATLTLGPIPAIAHPISHPGPPVVRNLRPAFGEVVESGPIAVAAQVVCDVAITGFALTVDGANVPAYADGPDPSHPTIVGEAVNLDPGEHLAELQVVGSDGRTGGRAWRISVSGLHSRRIAGTDRIGTAVAISQDLYPSAGSAEAAVLARSDDFADALAGAALAKKVNGPVLLTSRVALSGATADELHRVLSAGATVYLLGGAAALADQVATDVTAAGFATQRVAGDTRFGTAVAVAGMLGDVHSAIVVNGGGFADALGASSPSAMKSMPILLTARDSVPPETAQYLEAHALDALYVVGGDVTVSDATVAALGSAGAVGVTRVSGPDRWATSIAVAHQFFPTGSPLVVASGLTFPDALAGGPLAAELGAPVLLSPPGGIADAEAAASLQPSNTVLLGGPAALSDNVAGDIRRALYDAGGPLPRAYDPLPGGEIHDLGVFSVAFNRGIDIASSNIYVSMNSEEVPGYVTAGELNDTLQFHPTQMPMAPAPDQPVDVRVIVAAFDGSAWRHLDYHLIYRKVAFGIGATGPAVLDLQQRLLSLGYWIDVADGQFGGLTQQAVYAFQKVQGLPRTGVADESTRNALAAASRPAPRTGAGHVAEVDLARQVLFLVTNGHVDFVFNTSTGNEQPFTVDGRDSIAHTPTGTFTIFSEVDGPDVGPLGVLWRPKYFTYDGVAIHGSDSVPPYPASHGCVRVTYQAMDWMWGVNALPIGTHVIVY